MSVDQRATVRKVPSLFVLDNYSVEVPGKQASGVRQVSATLDLFGSHFPRMAVLPGVIVLGCLARVAATLLGDGDGGVWTLRGAERIRYRHFVQPGDELVLTVNLVAQSPEHAVFQGTASVAGRPVATVQRMRLIARVGDAT